MIYLLRTWNQHLGIEIRCLGHLLIHVYDASIKEQKGLTFNVLALPPKGGRLAKAGSETEPKKEICYDPQMATVGVKLLITLQPVIFWGRWVW